MSAKNTTKNTAKKNATKHAVKHVTKAAAEKPHPETKVTDAEVSPDPSVVVAPEETPAVVEAPAEKKETVEKETSEKETTEKEKPATASGRLKKAHLAEKALAWCRKNGLNSEDDQLKLADSLDQFLEKGFLIQMLDGTRRFEPCENLSPETIASRNANRRAEELLLWNALLG